MRYAIPLFLAGLLCLSPRGLAQSGEEGMVKPINLDKLNTEDNEDDPFITVDGLTLYYAAKGADTYGIYVSKRGSANAAFPAGKAFMTSKDYDQRSPLVHNGIFYYASNEVPDPSLIKEKNFDIFKKMGMQAPIPVLGVSERTDELFPWITPAGKEFYFSRRTEDGWTLFTANGPTPGPIGKARSVGFPAGFRHATLTKDALTLYLQGRLDDGRSGLFRSKRAKVGGEWSKPEALTVLNDKEGPRGDMSPCLSADGTKLYSASDRPGGKGGLDIWYVATKELK